MEVSDEVLKGLEICKTLADDVFEKLLVESFHTLSTAKEASYELLTGMHYSVELIQIVRLW
jgi:hypothetical protein